ncbi:MAG: O-antigen ligase family protein [Verrucomicrobiae bacterium]|nr:O-antigen ligase family protein [Verrucomicrobiae bacterium]
MDFAAIVLYLIIYYVRPQEWSGFLSSLRPVTAVMIFAIASLFLRERGVQWRSLLRSPQDWLMLLYFLYLTFFVYSDSENYKLARNLFIIYFVIVLALTDVWRLRRFLYWWAACIGFVVLLALASQIGIDPLEAKYYTMYACKGRLALPLSIFNNPNALGHSVVPLLGMIYFFFIWRRPIFVKEVGFLALALPLVCLYLTLSKGAFLAAFVAVVAGLTVGRPKVVQILVLLLALTAGWAALQKLPRMEELRVPRQEEGIRGRLLAWQFGLEKLQNERYGVGLFEFGKAFQRRHGYFKAPHSSYVEAGAEQGWVGLVFFVGVLYACFRSLLTLRVSDPEDERLRRVLLVILVSYAASSWMIGWAYKNVFFVTVACISAFHRHLRERITQEQELATMQEAEASAAMPLLPAAPAMARTTPTPAAALASVSADASPTSTLRVATGLEALAMAPAPPPATPPPAPKALPKFWYRLGILDVALILLSTYGVVKIWTLALQRM